MAEKILIIGLGLIGGSLGLALQGSALVQRITGLDSQQDAVKQAIAIGAIQESPPLDEAVSRASVIFLCTPMAAYAQILQDIMPFVRPGTLITDVGSTKMKVQALFSGLPADVCGIGGHPMAGAEIAGIQGADRYLYENAVYVLTPAADTPRPAIDRLSGLIGETGAKVHIMEARLHDRIVAQVSHVPHLAAAALLNVTRGDRQAMMMAAGGFRDTTRVASGNPGLWEDIVLSNRKYIIAELDKLISELQAMQRAVADGDRIRLRAGLEQARKIRAQIPHLQRTYLGESTDIVCIVPDKPGVIGQLGNILGSCQVNIMDLEILRIREGDGGTIRISVPDDDAALRAVEALSRQHIKAWMK
jgi:prephenate dehydrogenase